MRHSMPGSSSPAWSRILFNGRKNALLSGFAFDQLDVRSRRFAALRCKLVPDALALIEGLETQRIKSGDVNEHIRAAVIRLDEAKAFYGVEPFYCTGCHDIFLL